MADNGMSKVQITLILGVVCLILPCIPCVGTTFYMIGMVATMVMGFLAHSEAKETGEDTTMAKVGMALSVIPAILLILFMVAYVLLIVVAAVAGNM